MPISQSMKAISFSNPILSHCRRHHQRQRYSQALVLNRRTKSFVVNARRGTNDGGNIVDENMIVLRMRIREVEMNSMPPTRLENWMEWEKKYYEQYIRDVCEAMMMLQMCLMNNRPSVVMGTLTLLMLTITISASIGIYNFTSLVWSL
ncbi:hypothetical protein Hdeb2414_s0016g00474711 [Helianthus debilis subsp. tardiflorus]